MDKKMIVGICIILLGTLLLIMSASEWMWMCRSANVIEAETVREDPEAAGNGGS